MAKTYWPLKPDVVFEGGNVAKDSLSASWMRSLSLLTTDHESTSRIFTTARATSAATALASRFAAQIMAVYPNLRPETLRALIVHSAEWTTGMKRTFMPAHGNWSKNDYLRLVRRCGFGVPDLDRALWSVANSLTMVIEESLHPFKQGMSSEAVFRDMHLHQFALAYLTYLRVSEKQRSKCVSRSPISLSLIHRKGEFTQNTDMLLTASALM